jgi:uncharacterized protein (DUF983 family)
MVFGAAPRSLLAAMAKGLRGACPSCGHGSLYHRYLKVNDTCPKCGEELHHQRADDAPPYFTMFIVGHLIVPLALLVERLLTPPTWVHMALWIPGIIILSLTLLPRIKGVLIGFQWANRMHGFGGHVD